MRIPFLNVFKSEEKNGWVTPETLKSYENNFNNFYKERVLLNTNILNKRLEAARMWSQFVLDNIKDIPKECVSEIRTIEDPNNNLESVANPRVYLGISYSFGGSSSYRQYEVFACDGRDAEKSVCEILEDIRKFKNKIKETDGEIDTLIKGGKV